MFGENIRGKNAILNCGKLCALSLVKGELVGLDSTLLSHKEMQRDLLADLGLHNLVGDISSMN